MIIIAACIENWNSIMRIHSYVLKSFHELILLFRSGIFQIEYQKEFLSHCILYFLRLRFVGSISFRFDSMRKNASKIWLAGGATNWFFSIIEKLIIRKLFRRKNVETTEKAKWCVLQSDINILRCTVALMLKIRSDNVSLKTAFYGQYLEFLNKPNG